MEGKQENEEEFFGVFGGGGGEDDQLTRKFSMQEIKEIVLTRKKNKAPGMDGIINEFYMKYWNVIGEEFTEMVNEAIERGVTETQGTAIIKLIPKKRNPETVKEYRPVSLLCGDYKIVAAAIANRLQKNFKNTVGNWQVGGIRGRKIEDNIAAFRDILELYWEKGRPGAIISLDLEKAYHLVNRDTLWKIMSRMGYGEKFIGWLRALYNRPRIKIENKGDFTESIDGRISLRQGCPASMNLFALFIEPLLKRLDKDLEGVSFGKEGARVKAMVDDVTVLVSSNEDVKKRGI